MDNRRWRFDRVTRVADGARVKWRIVVQVDKGIVVQVDKRFIDVDGIRSCYRDVGSGAPVVLLHGSGPGATGLSNFSRNIEHFARGNRVIVLDLPGFGETDNKLPEGMVYAEMSAFVVRFLDRLGVERASFVGNSMGGGIALKIALDTPERVDRLVLMGTGGGQALFSPMPTEGLRRMRAFFSGSGPSIEKLKSVLELLVYDQTSITPELIQERLDAASRPNVKDNVIYSRLPWGDLWRENLASVIQPTFLIWGREDRVVPLDASFLLLKTLPNAQLHIFPNCGHWAQWEKAHEFNVLVGQFLERQ
jgi:4,5:9,10-diseco-3-hydroxy-5,9,17-trioxoandrosta-1(10),2-diene-4-oate hydrolase